MMPAQFYQCLFEISELKTIIFGIKVVDPNWLIFRPIGLRKILINLKISEFFVKIIVDLSSNLTTMKAL
jgi:hypothetical protein